MRRRHFAFRLLCFFCFEKFSTSFVFFGFWASRYWFHLVSLLGDLGFGFGAWLGLVSQSPFSKLIISYNRILSICTSSICISMYLSLSIHTNIYTFIHQVSAFVLTPSTIVLSPGAPKITSWQKRTVLDCLNKHLVFREPPTARVKPWCLSLVFKEELASDPSLHQ